MITSRPRPSAVACSERLTITAARPASQSGRRIRRSRTAESKAAPERSLAATRCCTTLATAKVAAAVIARAIATGCAAVPVMRLSRSCAGGECQLHVRIMTFEGSRGYCYQDSCRIVMLGPLGRDVWVRQCPVAEPCGELALECQRLVVVTLEQRDEQGQQQEVVAPECE